MVERIVMSCDVLIAGGGSAGAFAAITAAEQGASVIVVEQAHINRSGDAGHGNDHIAAYLNLGGTWDTREEFLNWYVRLAQGLIPRNVADATNVSVVPEMIKRLEDLGVPLRNPQTGKYIRTSAFDQPEGYWINFEGFEMKPLLAKEGRRLGAKNLNRVMIADLLKRDDGRVIGAVGFNIRSGEFYVISAKTVILSTGSMNTIWESTTPYYFNTWHGAYNGAASFYMAWNAGAEIANCELSTNNVVPKGFNTPGYNAIFGMGGHLINALGERFVHKYHPRGEKGPKWATCWAIYEEKKAGRGPIFVDCRHLSPEALEYLTEHLLPVDKLTYMDYIRQKGIDLSKDLLEVDISEQALTGFTGDPKGIVMDEHCWTGVEGLYVAGTVARPCYALTGAFTTGITAGREAGKKAVAMPGPDAPDEAQVKALEEKTYAPLRREKGITWQEFEKKRQRTMSRYAGFERNEKSLQVALDELKSIRPYYDEIKVDNYHELMRATASGHMLDICPVICWAALERKESRFGHGHKRSDYPEMREEYHGSIILKKAGDSYSMRFEPAEKY